MKRLRHDLRCWLAEKLLDWAFSCTPADSKEERAMAWALSTYVAAIRPTLSRTREPS